MGLLEEVVMVLFLLGYTVAGVKQYNPRKEIVFISIYIDINFFIDIYKKKVF